ncbi:hypothetical protein [Thermoplasma sp. Kam2015]|uniref:hypothetical protein n=1 Tax=Thermoplasma sp. Kam2015 TaxID=2094122 RepID=UPI0012935A4F|nr:hypothetical protein [Thermoplasma sp. Kam2015]
MKLLALSVLLILLGSGIIGYSYTQHPIYHSYSIEDYSVNGSSNITLYNFFGIPSNLSITTGNSTTWIRIYIISEYRNFTGVTVISTKLIENITLEPRTNYNIFLPAQYSNIPYDVQILAKNNSHTSLIYSTKIEKTAYSNVYIESIGILILIAGTILFAIYLTKFKKD